MPQAAIGHICVGVGLTYSVLCGFLNTTRIWLTGSELIVRHSPMPWRGNQRIAVDQIAQLYCKQNFSHNQRGGSSTFDLCAKLIDNRTTRIASGFESQGEPLFLEYILEQRMGIAPQHVPGEYRA